MGLECLAGEGVAAPLGEALRTEEAVPPPAMPPTPPPALGEGEAVEVCDSVSCAPSDGVAMEGDGGVEGVILAG